jgi:hypothetical protein
MKTRKPSLRLSEVVAFALIVGATGTMSLSLALAASDCSKLIELADWAEHSSVDISVASGAPDVYFPKWKHQSGNCR